MWDVFISHASEDKDAVARPLAIALQTHGLTTWLDVQSMFAHDRLDEKIEDGLRRSKVIVLILSSRYLAKSWTVREMTTALELESPSACVVIPLLHDIGEEELAQIPAVLRNRAGVSTRESLETAIVRLVAAVRAIRQEPQTGWIHFLPDGRPADHMLEAWLAQADASAEAPIRLPSIAWPAELISCIARTERFAERLALAVPLADRPQWFDFHGIELRGMDIQACMTAPAKARSMMECCPTRLACLAEGLKANGGYSYAKYSARVFLFLALRQVQRTINFGAVVAGSSLPDTTINEDIAANAGANVPLGSVYARSEALSAAIRPHRPGGDLPVLARVDHIRHLRTGSDGGLWMDFFEDFLVPQAELELLIFGSHAIVAHSCRPADWIFRRFRDQQGEAI